MLRVEKWSVLILGLVTALFATTLAFAANWTDWELQHSVARKGDWLVIKQPNAGFCYVKQSYADQPKKMEMSMKIDSVPFLPLPYFRGLDGDVSYWVDKGPVRIIHEKQAKNPLKLSTEVIGELKRGKTLFVRVKPVGQGTVEQQFSLTGFADAVAFLSKPICRTRVQ